MRRFSPEYLEDTRRGLWGDRSALEPLALSTRDRVLDVGCGTGELTRVLREESPGTVVGIDADRRLLAHVDPPTLQGDATRLPVRDRVADLVACQALLVNLPDPVATVREFRRVSSDLVAVIEPDNAGVAVDSTVAAEATLAADLREAYITGVDTDVTIGARLPEVLDSAGLEVLTTATHYHHQTVEPPYTDRDRESARQKAAATQLDAAKPALLAGDLTESGFDALRRDWQSMGRTVIDQMDTERYRRAEVVPFHVAVGRVPAEADPNT
ncbi:MAG: class I SAM-dependent methyltransferase [Halobacteriaceae archaeon]